jgi:hypothetical protein
VGSLALTEGSTVDLKNALIGITSAAIFRAARRFSGAPLPSLTLAETSSSVCIKRGLGCVEVSKPTSSFR